MKKIIIIFFCVCLALSMTSVAESREQELAGLYNHLPLLEDILSKDMNKELDIKLDLLKAEQKAKTLTEELEKEYDASKETELRKLEAQIEDLTVKANEIEAKVKKEKQEYGRIIRRIQILESMDDEVTLHTMSTGTSCNHSVYVMLDRGGGCYDFVPYRYMTNDEIWAMGTEDLKAKERTVQGTCIECNRACSIVYDWWYNFLRIE